ncbi:MAG: class I SAM-dependent methyltransferase [Archangiaceae bacterium]|nr:class I SAM-dependent methyltransferase [Archangiaceae bacterium]
MNLLAGEVRQYLAGQRFSNGLRVSVGRGQVGGSTRFEVLDRLVRGRSVLHVGFADHLELIKQKREQGRWLHDRLLRSCRQVAGVDINVEAVEFVRSLGISDVYAADLLGEVPQVLRQNSWDLILLGEVVEHLDNPVGFLSAIRAAWQSPETKLLVTVPNAFSVINIRMAMQNIEYINTDHRFWFTPFTISKVLRRAGWNVETLDLCQFDALPEGLRRFDPRDLVGRVGLSQVPLLRDTIVVTASRIVG